MISCLALKIAQENWKTAFFERYYKVSKALWIWASDVTKYWFSSASQWNSLTVTTIGEAMENIMVPSNNLGLWIMITFFHSTALSFFLNPLIEAHAI